MTEPLDFNLVLQQDLANIVAKSAAGAPLTARERQIIESQVAKAPSSNGPAQPTQAARVEDTEEEPKSDQLQGETLKRGRNGFFHLYPYYVDIYDHSERTIKRWVAAGRKGEDPIDLDDPEQVHAWWTRNMKKDVPAGIQKALIAHRKLHPVVATVTVESERAPASLADPLQFAPSDDEIGLDAMVSRLEHYELVFARKANEPGGAKVWLDTISRFTATLEKLRKEKEQQGLLIPKDQSEVILAALHGTIEQSVRGGCPEFCKSVGVPHTPAIEANWSVTCDRIFLALCRGVFHAV